MSLLFDTSPEEPKRRPARREPKVEAPPEPIVTAVFTYPAIAPRPLGRTEGVHTCPDSRCLSDYHEILDEDAGFWRLECLFCGTGQRVKAIRGYLKPREESFVFPGGDYAGMTPGDVWADPRGRAYVEWAAGEHKVQAVREACKRHIDAQSAAH